MDETVEAVARALYASEESLDGPAKAIPEPVIGTYQRRARAAIEALKAMGWKPPEKETTNA